MKTFELFKGRWHYWTVYYPGSLIRLSLKRGEKILKIGNFHWVNFLFTFLLLWWQSSCKHISNNDDTQTRKTQRKIHRTDVALKSNQSTARPNIWVGAMSHDTLISRKVSTRWGLFVWIFIWRCHSIQWHCLVTTTIIELQSHYVIQPNIGAKFASLRATTLLEFTKMFALQRHYNAY